MSRFGSRYNSTTAMAETEEKSSVLFTFVPRPGSDLSAAQAQEQANLISSLHKRVRDLNDPNHMTKTTEQGVSLYQTTETYGKAMSVEAISEVMNTNDLTLRVTFRRPGYHSSATAFELSPSMLEQLVQEEVDAHGTKMLELRIKAEARAENPRNGSMFVSVEPKRGLHYFTNVDFKIDDTFDKLSHRN